MQWRRFISEIADRDVWGLVFIDYYHHSSLEGQGIPPSEFMDREVPKLWRDELDLVEFHRVWLCVAVQLLGADFDAIVAKSIALLKGRKAAPTAAELEAVAAHYDPYGRREVFMERARGAFRMSEPADARQDRDGSVPNPAERTREGMKTHVGEVRDHFSRLQASPGGDPESGNAAHAKPPLTGDPTHYDVFISHASEDKDSVARPLFSELTASGVTVWFDEATLELGDSLRRRIDDGLARCKYGIVILSPSFLAKEWPQRELDGLVARETSSGEKAILPVWHDLDATTLARYSPTLADKVAVRSSEGIPAIVSKVRRVLKK